VIDLQGKVTQAVFGEMVGISQPAVSDLLSRGVIVAGQPVGEWLKAYCHHLREQAAGRAAAGELDLAGERAALAKVQRERIEMQNAVTRKQLAPVTVIEEVLARVGRQIVGILEAIPVQLKRRSGLTADDLDFITREIVKARNLAAAIELEDPAAQDGPEEDDLQEVTV
jgi:terminase small subunit / prophage DNA-packing protein